MCQKKRKRNKNIDHSHNLYRNTYSPTNKHQLRHYINEKNRFELQGIGWNDQNTLQIDDKNANRKYSNNLKTNNIINLYTIRFKLNAMSKIIHSILNKKPMRLVSFLRLHGELKRAKRANSKKLSQKTVEANKKRNFW